VREKHYLAGLMNSNVRGGSAGWLIRPANTTDYNTIGWNIVIQQIILSDYYGPKK